MLRDHADAVEADLRRFYGVCLADLWRGALSLRELSVYIAHLPPGSAVWAAEHGVPFGTTPDLIVLTDIFHAVTGSPHPLAPPLAAQKRAAGLSDTVAALKAQQERLARERG